MENLKDYQTLVAAIVALMAALIGFSGVIYSQRRISKIAAEGRSHQEKLAKEQGERQSRGERDAFRNAITGELSALQVSFDSAVKLLLAQISIAEELGRQGGGRKSQPRVVFRFSTPVFDSHVPKIGLLSPSQSFEVSKLYGLIKSFSIQNQDQVPEMESAMAVRIMQSVQESLRKLSAHAETLKADLSGGTSEIEVKT